MNNIYSNKLSISDRLAEIEKRLEKKRIHYFILEILTESELDHLAARSKYQATGDTFRIEISDKFQPYAAVIKRIRDEHNLILNFRADHWREGKGEEIKFELFRKDGAELVTVISGFYEKPVHLKHAAEALKAWEAEFPHEKLEQALPARTTTATRRAKI